MLLTSFRIPALLLLLAALLALTILPARETPTDEAAVAPAQQTSVTVFAASSLADAFREVAAAFEAETSVPVTINFGSSSQLRTQLKQGAVADVFASADQAQMDNARRAGTIQGDDVTFAMNRLVVITPRANSAGIMTVADLAQPDIRFVTAAPEVPIGVYTQNMFERMSQIDELGPEFKARANANIVSREPNVRQVVAKVLLGEADAAVVYLSDVTPQAAPDLVTIPIPDELNTIARYPIARVASDARANQGQAFIDMVLSPTGQIILQKWNFTPVDQPMFGMSSHWSPAALPNGASEASTRTRTALHR